MGLSDLFGSNPGNPAAGGAMTIGSRGGWSSYDPNDPHSSDNVIGRLQGLGAAAAGQAAPQGQYANSLGWAGRGVNAAEAGQAAGNQAFGQGYAGYTGAAGQQGAALANLANAAAGRGPSQAQIVQQQGISNALHAQLAAAASARGGAYAQAAAQQNAAGQAANIQGQAVGQGAALRAQEMQAAQQNYMQGSLGIGGQALQAAQAAGQQQLAGANLASGANMGMGTLAGQQAQANAALQMQQNTLGAQTQANYEAQALGAQQANLNAELAQQGFGAQAAGQNVQNSQNIGAGLVSAGAAGLMLASDERGKEGIDPQGDDDGPSWTAAAPTPLSRYEISGLGLATPTQRGNIDLYQRPIVHNPDGSISTVYSMSSHVPGVGEVLYPGVNGDRQLSEDEALDQYKKTGKHLGVFKTPADSDRYAEALHLQQAETYGDSGDNAQQPLATLSDVAHDAGSDQAQADARNRNLLAEYFNAGGARPDYQVITPRTGGGNPAVNHHLPPPAPDGMNKQHAMQFLQSLRGGMAGAPPPPMPTMPQTSAIQVPGIQAPAITSDEDAKEGAGDDGDVADAYLKLLAHSKATYSYKDDANQPVAAPRPHGARFGGVMAQAIEKTPEIGRQLVTNTPRGKVLEGGANLSAAMMGLGRLAERVQALEARHGSR